VYPTFSREPFEVLFDGSDVPLRCPPSHLFERRVYLTVTDLSAIYYAPIDKQHAVSHSSQEAMILRTFRSYPCFTVLERVQEMGTTAQRVCKLLRIHFVRGINPEQSWSAFVKYSKMASINSPLQLGDSVEVY
jgi:hypothetical protein